MIYNSDHILSSFVSNLKLGHYIPFTQHRHRKKSKSKQKIRKYILGYLSVSLYSAVKFIPLMKWQNVVGTFNEHYVAVKNSELKTKMGTKNILNKCRKQNELHNNIIYAKIYAYNTIHNL